METQEKKQKNKPSQVFSIVFIIGGGGKVGRMINEKSAMERDKASKGCNPELM